MPETIGQQLKQAREARNLTFGKVTQVTHIQSRLLEAMEADDFESLPSPVQARAFLRLYAGFLGLSLEDMIARQRAGVTGSPIFPSTQLVSIQSQALGSVSGDTASDKLAEEPHADKSPDEQEKRPRAQRKSKGFFSRIRKTPSQPEPDSAPVESALQTAPAVTEPIADTQEVSIEAHSEESKTDRIPPELPGSQAIFIGIGEVLRQRREALSLTLEEIERHTHVRTHYLQALELGDFDHLPSSVQTRGMLNNYAHFLDMDVDAILLRFAEGLQAQRLERQPAPIENTRNAGKKNLSKKILPSGFRRYLSMDVLTGVGLILILLIFAIWGSSRVMGLRAASTPQSTARSISDILVASPAAGTVTPTPTNNAADLIPSAGAMVVVTLPAAGQGPVQVVVVALGQAFMRATVDGKIQFEGRLSGGTAYPFSGDNQIEILTGNGAAVSILFNQSDLGPMGRLGEVVDRIYTAKAILNPTATLTPTPTITPTSTLTPRFSPTPSSTATKTPAVIK